MINRPYLSPTGPIYSLSSRLLIRTITYLSRIATSEADAAVSAGATAGLRAIALALPPATGIAGHRRGVIMIVAIVVVALSPAIR